MNREIKFRALYLNEWYEVEELRKWEDDCKWTAEKFKGHNFSPDSEHIKCIVQFTGLKDKNGKEIYEGDILKCYDHPTDVESGVYEVKYRDSSFFAGWLLLSDWGSVWLEVIGNIYENPELLK